MKTAREAALKYTTNSLKSFLDREPTCDEKWVVGIARASSMDDVDKALAELSYHSNKKGLEFLKDLVA